MVSRRYLVAPTALFSSLALAACGSSPAATTTTPNATTTSAAPTTTTTIVHTVNLRVTPAVRRSLLEAAAAYHQLPSADFTSLRKGMTYYAFDPARKMYYAAAGLVPISSSQPAQVSTQDDGAYDLFTRLEGSPTWTVYSDGLGAAQDSTCPIEIPAPVLVVWNWHAASCYPPIG
jgi:predicted lipoprotein with Yx(FWY)xxD motif